MYLKKSKSRGHVYYQLVDDQEGTFIQLGSLTKIKEVFQSVKIISNKKGLTVSQYVQSVIKQYEEEKKSEKD